MISYSEAYRLTLEHIQSLELEMVELLAAGGRVAASDLVSKVDSPSLDVSLKDGYALQGADVQAASSESPIRLRLVGRSAAGGGWQGKLRSGEAVRILSGAPLPDGADAVISEEFTRAVPGAVDILNNPGDGRNILPKGTDIRAGQMLIQVGQRLTPTMIGLLAAAGFQDVPVVRQPRVAVVATGDEVLAPGQPMVEGKLYASNLFTLASWCLHYGFEVATFVLKDDEAAIRAALSDCLEKYDAVLTSGGAWKGERDLVVHILDGLGWQKIYHRVRIGPGKAVGFGMFQNKPVFCLPGGPPSNHMAFLQLGLPGLQKLAGEPQPGLPRLSVSLAETISGQVDWTQFVHGRLIHEDQRLVFQPLKYLSRLQDMAQIEAIAMIPEGQAELVEKSRIMVQVVVSSLYG